MNTEIFICTVTNVWSGSKSDRAMHPDAVYLGDTDHGEAKYQCPHYGLIFYVELPQ